MIKPEQMMNTGNSR